MTDGLQSRARMKHPATMSRFRLGLARTATGLLTLSLWTWTSLKGSVTLIGASTVGDDFNQLLERLPNWANWLFSTPWWVPSGLAAALTVFLIWLSWPKKQSLADWTDAQITPMPHPANNSASKLLAQPTHTKEHAVNHFVSTTLRKVVGLDEWVMDIKASKDINPFIVRLDVQEYVTHLDRFDKWRCRTTFTKERVIEGETFYIHLIKWDWPGKGIKWAFWCYEGHDSPDEQTAEAGRLMVSDEFARCQLVFRSGSGESQTVKFVVLSRHRNNPAECPVLISENTFNYDGY